MRTEIAAMAAPAEDPTRPQRRTPALASVKTLRQAAVLFFRYPSPKLLAANFAVLLAFRLIYGHFGAADLFVIGGVLLYWPFQEWFLHIYLLHWKPRTWRGITIDPLAARAHRAHHREPWNLDYVFLPMPALVVLVPLNVLAWWMGLSELGTALTGMTAMAGAALGYEWVHYLTHTPYRPRSGYYRSIWRGHRLHHFKNERFWHGFTAPVVDTLLRTNPDPKRVATSETCRDLDARP